MREPPGSALRSPPHTLHPSHPPVQRGFGRILSRSIVDIPGRARQATYATSTTMRHNTRQQTAKRMREAERSDWRWLLWDSDVAREKIHPQIGTAWVAVLKEAMVPNQSQAKRGSKYKRKPKRVGIRLDEVVPTVALLEWGRGRGCQLTKSVFGCSAKGGDIDTLRWLRNEGTEWDSMACSGAVLSVSESFISREYRNLSSTSSVCSN